MSSQAGRANRPPQTMVGMLIPLATALVLSMTCQSPSTDRDLAEQLARSGRTVEALAIFERIVAENPTDVEVRLWIARLQLRMGRTEEAEAGFRAVLLEHPSDVDARIGLGAALTRRDAWKEALAILLDAEKDAGENADLFAALARAYRRAGDDRRALEYYKRAMALAPGDPDLVEAYEATVRAYGSSIEVEGLAEGGVSDARSASLTASVRVLPRLEIEGIARVQNRNGSSDTLGGGGGIWRVNRSTNLAVSRRGRRGQHLAAERRRDGGGQALPRAVRDWRHRPLSVVLRRRASPRYRRCWRGTPASAGDSPRATPTPGRRSTPPASPPATTPCCFAKRFARWRRVDMTVTYAYGIESFEDLTADRIGNLGAHTIAATVQFRLPSLTTVATTWEHQWRSNDTRLDRLTVLFVQGFR